MADQFRTSMSIVFWAENASVAQAEVDSIAALVPEVDQGATLATIEYVADGRPDTTPPEAESVAPPPDPDAIPVPPDPETEE